MLAGSTILKSQAGVCSLHRAALCLALCGLGPLAACHFPFPATMASAKCPSTTVRCCAVQCCAVLCCAVLCCAAPCFVFSDLATHSLNVLTHSLLTDLLTYSQVYSLDTQLQPHQLKCVMLMLTQLHAVCSVAFILQSTAFSCEHLESRCEAFLQQFQTGLEQMTDESLKAQVGPQLATKLSQPRTGGQ